MFSNTLEVNASAVSKNIAVDDWSWSVNNTSITPKTVNTTMPVERAIGNTSTSNTTVAPYLYYWYQYFATQKLFTTSTEYYAYKITINKPSTFSCTTDAVWRKVVVGTLGEIASGNCEYGVAFSSSMNPSIWYVSDYAEKPVYVGVMAYFDTHSWEVDADFGTRKFVSSGKSAITVTAYSKKQYESSIVDSIENGNDLQQEGNNLQQEGNDLQEESNKLQEESNKLQEESNETQKGILNKVTDFFGSFFQNLIDSVLSIFVPNSETMGELFNELNEFFSDTFGFLYYPFELLIDFIDMLTLDEEPALSLPSFEIMGHTVWEEQSIVLGGDSLVSEIFGYVRVGTGALLSFAFINYLRAFFDKRFGGGG